MHGSPIVPFPDSGSGRRCLANEASTRLMPCQWPIYSIPISSPA